MDTLKITAYTDPLCSWCYGQEPALTALGFSLGDQLELHNVMGLMLPDVRVMIGADDAAPARWEQLKAQLKEEYAGAAARTGMPFSSAHLDVMPPEDLNSREMCLGFEAVKLQDEAVANRFLRLLRQAALAEDVPVGRAGIVRELAVMAGADPEKYDKSMADGSAEKLLTLDVDACRAANVTGYPTLRLEYRNNELVLSGCQSPARLIAAAEHVSNGKIRVGTPVFTRGNTAKLLKEFGRVSGEEFASVFGMTD
ncbi:MAG: DsbA family protein, partial [Stomatobaculum sp.]|nr:DsbA family protein [Stomatobaculum sp.]